MLDRLVDAKASYLEALRLNPKLGVANAHLGLVIQRDGQSSDGLVWLKKAVELEPDKADFWQWLAELYEEMEEPGESIPCWERVLALEPDRAGAHLSLGWAVQEEGRLAEARGHFETAIRLQPEHGAAYMNLGGLQEELGRPGRGGRSLPHGTQGAAFLRAAARSSGDIASGSTSRPRPRRRRGTIDR